MMSAKLHGHLVSFVRGQNEERAREDSNFKPSDP